MCGRRSIHPSKFRPISAEIRADGKLKIYDFRMEPLCAYAGVLFGIADSGTGTTFGTIMTFIMVMERHPDIQQRALEEIRSVVGSERLPSLEDWASLPYVNALIKDDEVPCRHSTCYRPAHNARGYISSPFKAIISIPANTIVLPNIWGLSRDPSVYPSPGDFKSERFLLSEAGKEPMDPWDYMFGFGRRNCLGKP
ncbi:hypothetical protein EVG20_g6179 [Dentipellis fragilis]|uniref:Cytochrome P450 n=1 Tax=Dentipellis fragilis TaxID=205917 RepID=A0A4Y9YQ23_9AGAM|nr:hypothetical protein EVG20_g6179 [Dentipellis fragilis]